MFAGDVVQLNGQSNYLLFFEQAISRWIQKNIEIVNLTVTFWPDKDICKLNKDTTMYLIALVFDIGTIQTSAEIVSDTKLADPISLAQQ